MSTIEISDEHSEYIERLATERGVTFDKMFYIVLLEGLQAVVRDLRSGQLTKEELLARMKAVNNGQL